MEKITSPEKIFLIHGNQELLIKETSNNLIDQILEDRERDLCLERFNMEEIIKLSGISKKNSVDDFLISIETFPMLSNVKVILIDNFELIKIPKGSNDNPSINKLIQSLTNVMKNLPDYLWFIFLSKATKEKDFNKNIYQLIKKNWRIKKFVTYDNSSPNSWVLQRAKTKGLKMSHETAQLFIDIVGNDLSDLNHELEKMSILFSKEDFSEDHIRRNIRGHKNFSIFRMTEALSNKELLPAVEVLDNQLKTNPYDHVRIFAVIVMQFRKLINIKIMSTQSINNTDILSKISLPPFLGKQLIKQASNFTIYELTNIYLELALVCLRVLIPKAGLPHGVTGLVRPIGDRPSPPPCG